MDERLVDKVYEIEVEEQINAMQRIQLSRPITMISSLFVCFGLVYARANSTKGYDLEFVPTICVEATTLHSIAIGWSLPPPVLRDYVGYFQVTLTDRNMTLYNAKVETDRPKFVFENLKPETTHTITVKACDHYSLDCEKWIANREVDTKDRDPKFIPIISNLTLTSPHSLTMTWSKPPQALRNRVHQYKVMLTHQCQTMKLVYLDSTENSHSFENLTSQTSYVLKVASCGEFRTQCGSWSNEREAYTIEGEEETRSAILASVTIFLVLFILILVAWLGIQKHREKASREKFMEGILNHYNNIFLDSLNSETNHDGLSICQIRDFNSRLGRHLRHEGLAG